MTLLRQLQDYVLDTDMALSTVLLRGKVFGTRFASSSLQPWIESELEGYPNTQTIPAYRRRKAVNAGVFVHLDSAASSESSIPAERLPATLREYTDTLVLGNSVRSLEEILQSGPGPYKHPWPKTLVKEVAASIYPNYQCQSAWKVIPRSMLEGILSEIRSKLVNVLVAIEKTDPDIAENDQALAEVPATRLNLIVQKVVYGSDQHQKSATPAAK